MTKTNCSLVVSTYNWASALRLCLESIRKQKLMPDELLIADDGSAGETKALIDQYKKILPIPVIHIWQPDEGYQLARIRNKAFAAASGQYIIQIDGDLVLHPHFVSDHLSFSKPGTFVSGARALLSQEFTAQLLKNTGLPIDRSHVRKKYNALHSKLLSSLNHLFQRRAKNVNYVLGCNMAFWKKDLVKVNGYNEAFTGWGKEDNDIAVRLVNGGVKLRFLKFGGIVYHLFHHEVPRPAFEANEELFKNSVFNGTTYISKGMNQYISEPVN